MNLPFIRARRTLEQSTPRQASAHEMTSDFSTATCRFVLDCSCGAHFDTPYIDEALEISGEKTVEAAARSFIDQGAGGCLIKCGGDGAWLASRDGGSARIPVMRGVNVIDTSGCGDAFCAGFQVGLANGMEPAQAAHFASATAAQVASAVGSDGGVVDFATTERIMQAGEMPAGETA